MAGQQANFINFVKKHLIENTSVQVHYLFLERYDKRNADEIIYKHNDKFNSAYYPVEAFYKSIDLPIDIFKNAPGRRTKK
jgi:hypothetical protein